jgi:hypothetical protein
MFTTVPLDLGRVDGTSEADRGLDAGVLGGVDTSRHQKGRARACTNDAKERPLIPSERRVSLKGEVPRLLLAGVRQWDRTEAPCHAAPPR